MDSLLQSLQPLEVGIMFAIIFVLERQIITKSSLIKFTFFDILAKVAGKLLGIFLLQMQKKTPSKTG